MVEDIEHEIYRNDVDFEIRGWVREICGAYSRRSRIRFYVFCSIGTKGCANSVWRSEF